MTVRPATDDDLRGPGWLDDGTRTGLAAALAAGPRAALVLVAVDGAIPVGVLAADLPPWRGREHAWTWLLEVHPARRGAGTGTALLVAAHGTLAARGLPVVELSVADGNPRARARYERLGHRACGRGSDPGSEGPEPWTRMRRDPTAVREGVRPGPR